MNPDQTHVRLAQRLSAELGQSFTVRTLLTSAIEVHRSDDPDHVLVFTSHDREDQHVGEVAEYVRRKLA